MLLPLHMHTDIGRLRRVGLEFEFTGLALKDVGNIILKLFGGYFHWLSKYELAIETPKLGRFVVELDSDYLRRIPLSLASSDSDTFHSRPMYDGIVEGILSRVAPVELKTPPITFDALSVIAPLIQELRLQGATGASDKSYRALGFHINAEVVSDKVADILPILKAFLCLYEELKIREGVTMGRRLSPYIAPFPQDYIRLVIDPRYCPPVDILISDYLAFNPTRNRPLDMLPLFYYLSPNMVASAMDAGNVNPRPTFHYRLPNCSIHKSNWSYLWAWNHWVEIEALAYNAARLDHESRRCLGLFDDRGFLSNDVCY